MGLIDAEEQRWFAWIKDGLDEHRDACPLKPRAVYVSRELYQRFGWEDEHVCGVPVRPEDERPLDWLRVDCPCSAHGVEHSVALWAAEDAVRAADSEPSATPPR